MQAEVPPNLIRGPSFETRPSGALRMRSSVWREFTSAGDAAFYLQLTNRKLLPVRLGRRKPSFQDEPIALKIQQAPLLVALAAAAVFAVVFAGVLVIGTERVHDAFAALSPAVLALLLAVFAGVVALAVAGLVAVWRLSSQTHQFRMAIDAMSQGVCMFDSSERLVVCNAKYYELYDLTPEDAATGSTLSEVLARRIAKGSFARDPHAYRLDLVGSVNQGITTTHEVKSSHGRHLLVMNHPVSGGGWVGTHQDITALRQAEQERAVLAEQEQRRALVETAIATFREQAAALLQLVFDSASAVRQTALGLFDASGHASRHSKNALEMSSQASSSVEMAQVAANELSASIREMSERLEQTAEVVHSAAVEAQITDQDISDLSQAAQSVGDVINLIHTIADQTNLLALNATIEAARAGDAGKGFAVVAAEVKSLAVQTAQATQNISDQISNMQTVTGKAVAAIKLIASRMKTVNDHSAAASDAVQQQNRTKSEILSNVAKAADSAKSSAAGLAEVAAANAQTQDASQRMLEAAESTRSAVDRLRDQVESFLLKVAV
jgi:PAS domain-containing protein